MNERGEKILQVYNPGEGFGELALLYNSPRAASVRMISPSDGSTGMVYALGRAAFRQLVLEHNTKTKHGLELVSARDSLPRTTPRLLGTRRACLPTAAHRAF